MKKTLTIIYFVFVVVLSFYFHFHATTLTRSFLGGVITSLFFVGIYFCIKNISMSGTKTRFAKFFGVVILLFLIFVSSIFVEGSKINSNECSEIAVRDIFTNKTNIFCSYFAPWYTEVLGGEEARKALLEHCMRVRSSEPNICNIYLTVSANKDWTRGTVLRFE